MVYSITPSTGSQWVTVCKDTTAREERIGDGSWSWALITYEGTRDEISILVTAFNIGGDLENRYDRRDTFARKIDQTSEDLKLQADLYVYQKQRTIDSVFFVNIQQIGTN